MTRSQNQIHKTLLAHGFSYQHRLGTRSTSYQKGYVNVVVGPRGRITCWTVVPSDNTVTSVELPLVIFD